MVPSGSVLLARGFHAWFFDEIKAGRVLWPDWGWWGGLSGRRRRSGRCPERRLAGEVIELSIANVQRAAFVACHNCHQRGGAGVAKLRREGVLAGMNRSIDVRVATVDDALRISALLTALAEEFIVRNFTPEGRLHLLAHFGVSEVERRLKTREYRFHVAEDGAVLAGVVAVRTATHLQYLFVARSHQRTGLARRLWELARIDAIRGGNAVGRFTVNASGYAVPAYERLGFRRVGPVREENGVRFQPMELAGA